jgi:hypothetical protein
MRSSHEYENWVGEIRKLKTGFILFCYGEYFSPHFAHRHGSACVWTVDE